MSPLSLWAPADLKPEASPPSVPGDAPAVLEPARWPDAVEVDRVVPPSGNLTVGPQQFWLGTTQAGQTVTFWIDTTTVHLSIGGWRVKTVPSRLTEVDLAAPRRCPPGRPPAVGAVPGRPGCQPVRGRGPAGQLRRDHHPRQPGHPGRLPAGRAASPDPPRRHRHARPGPRRRAVAHPCPARSRPASATGCKASAWPGPARCQSQAWPSSGGSPAAAASRSPASASRSASATPGNRDHPARRHHPAHHRPARRADHHRPARHQRQDQQVQGLPNAYPPPRVTSLPGSVLPAPGILPPRQDHRQERSLRSRPSDGATRHS
jgi:hypothetical protein